MQNQIIMNMNCFSRCYLNLISVFLLIVANACNRPQQAIEEELPNIVILFSDELAPEYLSCYGGEIPTPNIDKIANQGIRFERAYTVSSMCTPSRFSLLTGTYPGRCMADTFLKSYPTTEPYNVAWNTEITSATQTIAKQLKEAGYVTGMVGKWHVGKGNEPLNLPAFSNQDDPNDPEVQDKLKQHQRLVAERVGEIGGFDYAGSVLYGNYDNFPVKSLQPHNFEWMTEGARTFIEQQKDSDKPFFLYVATTAVHGPAHQLSLQADVTMTLEGKRPDLAKYQSKRKEKYEEIKDLPGHEQHLQSGMWFLDEHVKAILESLEEHGHSDNTLVIFMADHNIEPGKATSYEKGLHVPLLMKWPGQISESSVSNELVQTVDMLPTFIDITGTSPEGITIDGRSVIPLFDDPPTINYSYLYAENGYTRAMIGERYKYIAFRLPDDVINKMESGEMEYAPNYLNTFKQAHSHIAMKYHPHYFDPDQLYDLENDPYEMNNLAGNPKYQDVIQTMKDSLIKILNTFDHPYNLTVPEFMTTAEYKSMAEKTREIGVGHIEWWKRDHGEDFSWPPVD
jgi:arylsulfatase A-like enzyme